jgi:hypothetical protein
MATTKKIQRRNVLQAGAAALGAALLPRAAAATPHLLDPAAVTPAVALEALRVDYLGKVRALAEELRPRFESGELRGFRSGDGEGGSDEPFERLDEICRERFGLATTETEPGDGLSYITGDDVAAYTILAVSPMAREITDTDADHACYVAATAVASDVLAVARDRRWYRPTPDESYCYGKDEWPSSAAHLLAGARS